MTRLCLPSLASWIVRAFMIWRLFRLRFLFFSQIDVGDEAKLNQMASHGLLNHLVRLLAPAASSTPAALPGSSTPYPPSIHSQTLVTTHSHIVLTLCRRPILLDAGRCFAATTEHSDRAPSTRRSRTRISAARAADPLARCAFSGMRGPFSRKGSTNAFGPI